MSNKFRELLRRKRKRNLTYNYLGNMPKIILIQKTIRGFLARKKFQRLQSEEYNYAAFLIQESYREYKERRSLREKNNAASTITRFIANIPVIRRYRIGCININLKKILVRISLSKYIARFRQRKITQQQRERLRNLSRPRSRIPTPIRTTRNERTTLQRTPTPTNTLESVNNRLRDIRNDIDNMLPTNRRQPEATRIRLPTRIPGNVNTPFRATNAVATPTRANRIITTPTQERTRNRIRERERANELERERIRDRIRNLRRTPPPPQITPPITPVLGGRARTPVRNTEINPITHRPVIQVRNNEPEPRENNLARHLRDLERQFQDPRIRQVYQNNRVMLPTGNRVIPGRNGGVHLGPVEDRFVTNIVINYPIVNTGPKVDCPICMENVFEGNTINPGCDHLICYECTKNMLKVALGNVTDNIPIRCPLFTTGCNAMITPYTKKIDKLILKSDYSKFEKYHIIKSIVPSDKLRYCPNSQCGAPFEIELDLPNSPPKLHNFKYFSTCLECETQICIFCNDFWHPNITCKQFQTRRKDGNDETNAYIRNYCKKCPCCKATVQKLQTEEQERHEKITGLAGGTQECHHVTCGACKKDFCWTCLKTYTGTAYYHPKCPISDCEINFNGQAPNITRLPIGQISHVKIIIYNNDNIIKEIVYQTNNTLPLVGVNLSKYTLDNRTAFLHCNKNGVVRKLEGQMGEYAFRQNNKAKFNI